MDRDEREAFYFGLLLGLALTVAMSLSVHGCTTAAWEQEAVEKGKAEWVIVDPKTGKTEWRWKPAESNN